MAHKLTLEEFNEMNADNLMGHLGMKFIKIEDNYAEATMPIRPTNTQMVGNLHGGASLALAESLAGLASLNLVYPDYGCVGMQVSGSHLSGGELGDTVIAKATLLHKGGRTHVWDINIYSMKTDRLISSIKVTNAIVPRKK